MSTTFWLVQLRELLLADDVHSLLAGLLVMHCILLVLWALPVVGVVVIEMAAVVESVVCLVQVWLSEKDLHQVGYSLMRLVAVVSLGEIVVIK